MNNRHETDSDIGKLRQRAERQLADTPPGDSPESQQRLLHELQVHQVELEMQNEALREARSTAEQALARYAELFDFAPMAYFTLAEDGSIHQTNFKGERLLTIDRVKITGRHFVDFVASEYRPIFKGFLEKVFAHADTQRCEMMLTLDGKPCWVAIEATADTSGKSCLAAMVDISERKRNEQELQLAATVYMAIEEAIVVADIDNRIVAINPAFSELTGYSSEEVIGQSTAMLKSDRQDQAFFRDMRDSLT
ncbi:MAG: PAS domain S-box protein, partial [Methylococcales bacterium]|nr:PAS domain S-box protein [Methylococcales bacterium]